MIRIGLVLPDVLGTYGDDGNALVLRQRARWRGIDAEIVRITYGQPIPDDLDVYTLGGGEDTAQILAASHLRADGGLQRAAAAGRPILAICAGLQVLGHTFRAGGRTIDGLGLLDATTGGLSRRAIGEVATTPVVAEDWAGALTEPLTGFENHMGSTILGPDARPLGTVTRGVGNNEETTGEGAVQGSIIATYMHGPVLARNPQLADLLLEKATGTPLDPLPLEEVELLRRERLRG
ncbi:glutamine amidotransferase [Corynebacterium sp. 13CS0277]|uniref:type 1 glutamine amidotransferase n=1 Tax=Corynebacterium sp. 13CS0277 TaxID=2071994 RepID=UPI000D028B61|nr:glutamine amidotransferase [Corynebacterium sp. 13CS0277]PRQ12127.1 glutamine amidotransferase [Corynebacterium sp. 13CS0277]